MEWQKISSGNPKMRTLAEMLFTHAAASGLIPLDVGESVQHIDIHTEDGYSGKDSVYRVFRNGAVDQGVEG